METKKVKILIRHRQFKQINASLKSLLILMLVFSVSACISLLTPKVESNFTELKAGAYELDTSHARLLFKVRHLGLSTYVGRFNTFEATLDFDPQNMAQAKLEAIIDMRSVDLNDEGLEDTIKGGSWLDTRRFPQAKFTSTKVTPIDANRFEFVGQLEWREQAREIKVQATFEGGAFDVLTQRYKLGFSATTVFKRSDFSVDAFIPLVGDEIELEAYVEFKRN